MPLAAPLGRGGHKASIAGSSTGGHPQTPGAGRSLRGCSAKGGDCSHECIATYVLMHGSILWSLAVSHVWWAAGVVLWTQGSTLHALAHRRAEGGRGPGGMMLRRRRMRGCKRELMCRRRAQTMRRRAVHAALHRTSIGRTEAAAGRPGGPWKLLRRDERRLRRVGRVAGRDPGIGWLPRRPGSHAQQRPRAALFAKRASVLSKEPRLRATGSTLNTLF